MDMRSYVDEFLNFLNFEKGFSVHTLSSYEHDLMLYAAYLKKIGCKDLDELKKYDLEQYIRDLREQGYKASSIERNISAVKGFHRFCLSENLVNTIPSLKLKLPQKRRATA